MSHEAFTLRIAAFFREHPMEWIDARRLEDVGGRQAWRTRVSNARKAYGMVIENRCRRMEEDDGTAWVKSEYRFVPADGKLF